MPKKPVNRPRQPQPALPALPALPTSVHHHYITAMSKGLAALDTPRPADDLKMAASQQYGANTPRAGLKRR